MRFVLEDEILEVLEYLIYIREEIVNINTDKRFTKAEFELYKERQTQHWESLFRNKSITSQEHDYKIEELNIAHKLKYIVYLDTIYGKHILDYFNTREEARDYMKNYNK